MLTATKLRTGVTFEDNEEPWRVVSYKNVHLSRGSGNVKLSIVNLRSGRVTKKTLKSSDQVGEIDVMRKKLQYLYREGDDYLFMDPVDFAQVELKAQVLEKSGQYLREGEEYFILMWDRGDKGVEALDLDLPIKMKFRVVEADPGVKGDTVGSVFKDCSLDNGMKVRVPGFIKKGDVVLIDTRSGDYVERVR